MHLPFFFHRLLQRGLPAAISAGVWLISLFIAAWLVAGWFWDQTAPVAISLPKARPADPLEATQSIAARQLMGAAQKKTDGAPTARLVQYRLFGAMTAAGRTRGFAIVGEDGKAPIAVLEGDDIAPGITLSKVLAEQVQLRYQDRSETIDLSRESPSVTPPPPNIPRTGAAPNRRQ